MILTIVTVSTSSINALIGVYRKELELFKDILDLRLFYAARTMSVKKIDDMTRSLEESDMIMVDLMGSPDGIVKKIYDILETSKADIVPYGRSARQYMKLGSFKPDPSKKPDMKAMRKMMEMAENMPKMPGKMADMMNLSAITKYFSLADETNIKNMLYLILRDYGGYKKLPKPKKPMTVPGIGICDPRTRTYHKSMSFSDKPLVAVLYYGHTYPNDTAPSVQRFCESIGEFAEVLPVAFSSPSQEDYSTFREIITSYPVDLVVNFMSFRLTAGPMGGNAEEAISILEEVNVPYLHPFFMSRRREQEWLDSVQGVSTSEFTISVMMSEFDGAIETMPLAAMSEPIMDELFHVEIRELKIIEERLEKCVSRIKKQLALRLKANNEKKIAVVCYNYPPGEGNVFGGAFLDTFKSIEKLLIDLKEAGYDVTPMTAEALIEAFSTGGLSNSSKYFKSSEMIKYNRHEFLNDLRNTLFHDKISDIQIMRDDKEIWIPGLQLGNVFIGLQPTRGIHEMPELVHDKELLPHEQYFAFYHWLEHEFHADAMIHVGTHGTLEFNKGKECGMSAYCIPDHLVGTMPHMYLYYASNPSEAMIAKRRSHANLIGYQPTEYVPGELYGDFVELSEMIDEYREASLKAPTRSEEILKDIVRKAKAENLPETIDELEHELYRMDQSLIPNGLHTFGKAYDKREALSYVQGLLMQDHEGHKALPRLMSDDYDVLLENNDFKALKQIKEEAYDIIESYINGENYPEYKETLEYGKLKYETCMENHETRNLLKVLSGQYNKAKLAGDIYRSPEVMPTGYNLYQFDPRKVPSQTAMRRGEQIASNTLEVYKKTYGELPKSTAVVLWGLETSRTQGETIGQILSYWGVRTVRSYDAWFSSYEIIPLEELGRPRIDVTINICGFFRDMFPNLIEDISKLTEELSALDEPDEMNYIKANSQENYLKLIEENMENDEAFELSTARIFGPPEGEYGTGITSIIETKNWEDENIFGESFIDRMQHVYSKNHRGLKVESLFKKNLGQVEMVSQLRSNHEYEVTDLDHYYEFFGGLAKAVEITKGKKVDIYISDTTADKIETETVNQSINRGIRTRLLNPKWIDGLLSHDYHGVQVIAQRFENVMGLAATTGSVETWIYDDMHKTYVADEEMVKRMKENNKYAYLDVLEHLLEYNQRGYWDASEEQLNQIKQVYLSVEGDVEEQVK